MNDHSIYKSISSDWMSLEFVHQFEVSNNFSLLFDIAFVCVITQLLVYIIRIVFFLLI